MVWFVCSCVISVTYKGELLVKSLENVRYPCSLSVSEKLCMSYFIIINPSTTGMLEDLSKQRKMIYLPSKYLLFWYGIKGTLALHFTLLPEFNLLFWDKAVLCLAWDNWQSTSGFWGLRLAAEHWSDALINTFLLGFSLGEGRSRTEPFLAFFISFHKSHADAAETLGLFFEMGASGGRSMPSAHPRRTMRLNGNWFAGYCLPKLFIFMCSSPSASESTDTGGCLHHGGSDISRAVVGTGNWEEFLSARSPRQGLAESPVPSAEVSSPRLLSNGKSVVVWPCSQ